MRGESGTGGDGDGEKEGKPAAEEPAAAVVGVLLGGSVRRLRGERGGDVGVPVGLGGIVGSTGIDDVAKLAATALNNSGPLGDGGDGETFPDGVVAESETRGDDCSS